MTPCRAAEICRVRAIASLSHRRQAAIRAASVRGTNIAIFTNRITCYAIPRRSCKGDRRRNRITNLPGGIAGANNTEGGWIKPRD